MTGIVVRLVSRFFARRHVWGGAIGGMLAAAAAPAAAFPIMAELRAAMNHAAADAPLIVLARDICGVHYEGRTKVTRYCNPPYMCDRANPGKCKPGPELQRQLDAERQRREEASRAAQQQLNQMRRDIDARLRNLRRTTRTTHFVRTPTPTVRTNDRRASNCNWENNLGSRALYCGNSNNDRIIPSPQYGPSRPSVPRPAYGGTPRVTERVPTVRTPTVNVRPPTMRKPSLPTILKLRLDVRYLESMERNDPDRAEWQNRIIARAKAFEAQGEDVAPALKEMIDDMNARVAARERAEHGPVTDNTPPPPAETPAPQPQAAAPPKPYSGKDEALCSYLMTLAPDQRDDRGGMTRLGQPVPAYCQPYLRSLPKPPEAEAVPAFYLPEREREEARQMADELHRQNVLPPDYGQ